MVQWMNGDGHYQIPNLDQHSGNRENIRDAMNDIANAVEHLRSEKGVNMELKKPTCFNKKTYK